MLVTAFIQWWYGPGWRDAAHRLMHRINETYLNFSVPILARTLFAPWRRIISPPGTSFQDRGRAMVDNAVSRGVGFSMRLIILITAMVLMALYGLIGGALLVAWPIIPLLGPILIVWGLVP